MRMLASSRWTNWRLVEPYIDKATLFLSIGTGSGFFRENLYWGEFVIVDNEQEGSFYGTVITESGSPLNGDYNVILQYLVGDYYYQASFTNVSFDSTYPGYVRRKHI